MTKRIVTVIDPKSPTECQCLEIDVGIIELALHLSKLGNQSREAGSEVKKEALEILINNIRPEVLEFATHMEVKLRENDKAKGTSWKKESSTHMILRALQEIKEFQESILAKKSMDNVLGEGADVANFVMFSALNYQEGH